MPEKRTTPSKILKFEFAHQPYSFNLEGWFNATEAAKRFGLEPTFWLNQRDTVEYLAALAEHLDGNSGFLQELNEIKGLDGEGAKSRRLLLALAKRTGYVRVKAGAPENGGGTWFHPKLAVFFARWLSVDFGVWCDLQIDTIIRSGIRAEGNANLLPLLLRQEPSAWELRFGPDYYRALARITGTFYTGHAGGTPALYGAITDKWVYGGLLPDDVHAQLKACRGASEKMHQWLTDGGQMLLDKQVDLVRSIANTSTDMRDFEARMMLVSGRRGQLGFVYPKAA